MHRHSYCAHYVLYQFGAWESEEGTAQKPNIYARVGSLPLGEGATSRYIHRKYVGLATEKDVVIVEGETATGKSSRLRMPYWMRQTKESSDKDLGHPIKANRGDVAYAALAGRTH